MQNETLTNETSQNQSNSMNFYRLTTPMGCVIEKQFQNDSAAFEYGTEASDCGSVGTIEKKISGIWCQWSVSSSCWVNHFNADKKSKHTETPSGLTAAWNRGKRLALSGANEMQMFQAMDRCRSKDIANHLKAGFESTLVSIYKL